MLQWEVRPFNPQTGDERMEAKALRQSTDGPSAAKSPAVASGGPKRFARFGHGPFLIFARPDLAGACAIRVMAVCSGAKWNHSNAFVLRQLRRTLCLRQNRAGVAGHWPCLNLVTQERAEKGEQALHARFELRLSERANLRSKDRHRVLRKR